MKELEKKMNVVVGRLEASPTVGSERGLDLGLVIQKFATHLELIKTWTKTVDLVSEASDELLVERHTLDSVVGLCVLRESIGELSGGLVDVGSGAGFPGVVAAVLFPETQVFLVEPRKKRANFLKEVRKELQLKNITVLEKGIEEVGKEELSGAELVVTRAFGKEDFFLAQAERLLDKGYAAILAGPSWEEGETKIPEMRFLNCVEYELYAGGPKRKLVIYKRPHAPVSH